MGEKIARRLTTGMATWSFSGIFLFMCILEIWFNHSNIVSNNLKFDPNTIILNLFLSLIAAIQGSIIMIAQKQADKDRDLITNKILEIDEKLLSLEESHDCLEKSMAESLKRIEEALKELNKVH